MRADFFLFKFLHVAMREIKNKDRLSRVIAFMYRMRVGNESNNANLDLSSFNVLALGTPQYPSMTVGSSKACMLGMLTLACHCIVNRTPLGQSFLHSACLVWCFADDCVGMRHSSFCQQAASLVCHSFFHAYIHPCPRLFS